MHELSITQNIVAIVQEKANGRKVVRVKLEIGKLSAIVPESIRFCFDVCSKDTCLSGAKLEINEVSPIGCCEVCRQEFALDLVNAQCPCGSRDFKCIAGLEMKIKEMEVE